MDLPGLGLGEPAEFQIGNHEAVHPKPFPIEKDLSRERGKAVTQDLRNGFCFTS